MDRTLWRYFAEIGSILSVFSLTFTAIVAYFAFEAIGISFVRVASLEDTILIGIGLLVRLLPLAVLGFFHFKILKYSYGMVKAFNEQVTPGIGLTSNRLATPYLKASLLFAALVTILLFYISISHSYYSYMWDLVIVALSLIFQFSFMFFTNFLIRKKIVSFNTNDPYYYIQENSDNSLPDEIKKIRAAFYRKVFNVVTFLFIIGAIPVLVNAAVSPLESDFSIVASGDGSISSDCIGSRVLWSGTRTIIYRCNGQLFVVHGPQNIVLRSDGINRLEQSLTDFVGGF